MFKWINEEKIKKQEQKRVSDNKWSCWLSASFVKCASWYNEAKEQPGKKYKEGAEKEFAQMAMKYLLELHELNPDGCRMVVDSWHNVINEMIETLEFESKWYKVFV